VRELIQDEATPAAVAGASLDLLENEVTRAAQRAALLEVRSRLGEAGAGVRAARAVLRERDGAAGR
jgi:lipid A disaccharide synthetase